MWTQDSLGTTRRVVSSFTFSGGEDFFTDNIRVRNDGTGDPLGCLGDLGWCKSTGNRKGSRSRLKTATQIFHDNMYTCYP